MLPPIPPKITDLGPRSSRVSRSPAPPDHPSVTGDPKVRKSRSTPQPAEHGQVRGPWPCNQGPRTSGRPYLALRRVRIVARRDSALITDLAILAMDSQFSAAIPVKDLGPTADGFSLCRKDRTRAVCTRLCHSPGSI